MTDLVRIQNKIDKAAQAYYRGSPSVGCMPDSEYDSLISELGKLNPGDERLTRVGVLYSAEDLRTKVLHPFPMGSLDNTDDGILGFESWHESIANKLLLKSHNPDASLLMSLKVDGSSVRAKYEDGKLVQVVTRGNGQQGEDITANGANFKGLPTTLPNKLSFDVRGEAVLPIAEYQRIRLAKLNQLSHSRGKFKNFDDIPADLQSNPRNIGNGILSRDSGEDADKVTFLAFDMQILDKRYKKLSHKLADLKSMGFNVVPHSVVTQDQAIDEYNTTAGARCSLEYEIDGMVVCLNDLNMQDKFVTDDVKTRMRPKYARAIKFPHKSAHTKLVDVKVSLGHTGAIVPTALLDEVRIGGVNVTHALLNNYEEIERLGLAIGDEVEVVLAGDIIPKIIRVSNKSGNDPIKQPRRCPCCGEIATKKSVGMSRSTGAPLSAVLYCAQPNKCPEVRLKKVKRWIGDSKKGIGILGIGDTILRMLWDSSLVNTPADLYVLTASDIENLSGDAGVIGHSRASEIVNNIQAKKHLKLSDFLGALGINLLGKRRAVLLSKNAGGRLNTLDDWLNDQNWCADGLQIDGLGDTIRDSIREGIDENRGLINMLIEKGVTVEDESVVISKDKAIPLTAKLLDGVSFCFTGTRECISQVEMLGAEVKNSVAKSKPSPDFLVQKDPLSTSGKTRNAESNEHTKIISVDYLKKCIKEDKLP